VGNNITIYDLDIDEDRYNRIRHKIKKLDDSRRDSKKYIGKKAFQLLDFFLEEEFKEISSDVDSIRRRLSKIEDVLDK